MRENIIRIITKVTDTDTEYLYHLILYKKDKNNQL